jgi:hypothetical protein
MAAGLLAAAPAQAGGSCHQQLPRNAVVTSSDVVGGLVLPEGITSFDHKLYIGTYNVISPSDSRIFVLDPDTGTLLNTIGGKPGEELVSAGALLGLTIDKRTGDLYAGNNFTGELVRIKNPGGKHPKVSLYAQLPAGAGPEDLNFNGNGVLYSSDSNLGVVWAVYSNGSYEEVIGPSGSGAQHSDNGLFNAFGITGLAPNGIVFSADYRTLYVANTYQDSIIAFDVDRNGHVSSDGRIWAQNINDDLQQYPSGFDVLVFGTTHLGASANTPINGPDGLALDEDGNVWAASILGDNLTVLNGRNGHVIRTVGKSAATQGGLLNMPAGMTFIDNEVYNTNLGLFADGSTHNVNGTDFTNAALPWTVTRQYAGVEGAGGNGNQ